MSHPNHLGAQRKRWKLSYNEVAQLLGYRFESTVFRAEKHARPLTIKSAIGCEIVFGRPVSELFPEFYAETEDAVMRRAAKLDEALREDFSHEANLKRDFLRAIADRVHSRSRP